MLAQDGGSNSAIVSLSDEVIVYEDTIRKYAKEYDIEDYVSLLQAIMMQESGGKGNDPMQASESGYNTKYPRVPNGITDPEYSIEVGTHTFSDCLKKAKVKDSSDTERIYLALQGYNYGSGYIEWAIRNFGGYSKYNAQQFSDNKKQELNELDTHTFTIEKVMARRDIEKISIDNGYKEKEFYKFEWDIKTKEEKQQFISKYIDNIVIDKTDTGSLDIKQINFRSSFIDKAVKLTQVGAYDYKLPFEVNHKQEMVLVSSPMKRKQVNKYLGYLREYFEIEYREDKGDRTENGMAVFDSAIPDNYELLKVIPIIDINLFKGKDITFGLVFRPTIKEIINEK